LAEENDNKHYSTEENAETSGAMESVINTHNILQHESQPTRHYYRGQTEKNINTSQ